MSREPTTSAGWRSAVSQRRSAPSSALTTSHTWANQNACGSLTTIWSPAWSYSASWPDSHSCSSPVGRPVPTWRATMSTAAGRLSMLKSASSLRWRLWKSMTHCGS